MSVLDPRTPDPSIWLNPDRVHTMEFAFPPGELQNYTLSFWYGGEIVPWEAEGDSLYITLTLEMIGRIEGRAPMEWILRDEDIGTIVQGEFYKARGNSVQPTNSYFPITLGNSVLELRMVGPRGRTGDTALAGRRWYGEGPPGLIIGASPGDEYLDKLSGNLYVLK